MGTLNNKLLQALRQANMTYGLPVWQKGQAPSVVEFTIVHGDFESRIDVQRDKWWTSSGGKLCVNLLIDDLKYRSLPHVVQSKHPYLNSLRLGQMLFDMDHWWEVNQENCEAIVNEIVSKIKENLLPLTESLKTSKDLIAHRHLFFWPISSGYAIDMGNTDYGMRAFINALLQRILTDDFVADAVRLGLLTDSDIQNLKRVQMQHRTDQQRGIMELVQQKGWERYLE